MSKKYDPAIIQIQNIERLEIMEEKHGVCFAGVNATFNHTGEAECPIEINVYGEVQALNGTGIVNNLEIIVTAYGGDGKVLGTEKARIAADKFFALCSLKVTFYIGDYQDPSKIRIYPTPSAY